MKQNCNAGIHLPVLADKIIEFISEEKEMEFFDCTLGTGGHAKKIFEKFVSINKYYGLDKDLEMLDRAKNILTEYNHLIEYIHGDYNDVEKIIKQKNIFGRINCFIFDLGVNSAHFDDPERGFSFRFDSRLDMRLNRNNPKDARFVVNTYREEKLADIIYNFGEERFSRRIAKNIVESRKKKYIESTKELADIILKSYPPRKDNATGNRIHPATKTFQALRIEVNDELIHLDAALKNCAAALKKNGIICVISFHSLEDRIVKNVFRNLGKNEFNESFDSTESFEFEILTKKPIEADFDEIKKNPRSRSAKLRVLKRICLIR